MAFRRGAGAGRIERRAVQLLEAHGLAESDSHSRRRERRVWMLTFLHASVSRPNAAGPDNFAYQLRRARLQELIENPQLSSWFAHAYAGVDP